MIFWSTFQELPASLCLCPILSVCHHSHKEINIQYMYILIKMAHAFSVGKGLVTEKDLPNVFRQMNSKVQTQKIRLTQMNPEWLRRSNCMFNSAEESLATGNDQIGGCSICCRLSRGSTIVVKNRDEHRATLSLVSLPSRLRDQCHPCRAPILACPRPTLSIPHLLPSLRLSTQH